MSGKMIPGTPDAYYHPFQFTLLSIFSAFCVSSNDQSKCMENENLSVFFGSPKNYTFIKLMAVSKFAKILDH